MNTPQCILDAKTAKFIDSRSDGIFLFDLFPDSNIIAFHEIESDEDMCQEIYMQGSKSQINFLGKLLTKNLVAERTKDGIWSGVVQKKNRIYIGYRYDDHIGRDQIIEILSVRFRRDLIEVCNLNNTEDRALIQQRSFRQRVAEVAVQGILDYYDTSDDRPAVAP